MGIRVRQQSVAFKAHEESATLQPLPEIAAGEPDLPPLPARVMRPNGREFSCTLTSLNSGGAMFLCEASVPAGEALVAYVEGLGRVEGIAGEAATGGFLVHFTLKGTRLARLEQNLLWLALKQRGLASENRRGTRFRPGSGSGTARVTLSDGEDHDCEVLDISLSGAAIRSTARPQLGSCVFLGRTQGRVIRHMADGFAIEFFAPLEPDGLHASLR